MNAASLCRLVLLGMIWGASFLFQRITVPATGAAFTAAVRLALAATMLLVVLLVLRKPLRFRERWKPYLILGLFNSALPFLCFASAARLLPAGYLAVINATVPLFTVLLVWAISRQQPSGSKLVGVVVGLAGVVVLARFGPVAVNLQTLTGFALALLAVLFYAGCAWYVRGLAGGDDPLVLAGSSQIVAAVAMAPLGLAFMPPLLPAWNVIAALLVLGLVCTGLAYMLYFRLLRDVGSEKAVTNTFLVPVFAQAWGALFLGERITLAGVAGCALVLVAVALVFELFQRRSQAVPKS